MLSVPLTTVPMEAKLVTALPTDAGWQFEPKWDGFRCLAFRDGATVELRAKSGKPLSRYFPDVVAALSALPARRFVIDGELAIPQGETLAFDALQLRLHPAASRVHKLATQSPALLIAFDMLMRETGTRLLDQPLTQRRAALEHFMSALPEPGILRLSPYTTSCSQAQHWLDTAGGALDGVIAKRRDDIYRSGERAMLKVKRLRTADCVVGGFRYASGSKEVGSLLLGLYNEHGLLDHVGFTSALPRQQRKALTQTLRALIEPPGFSGNAPGEPSRWSTERSTAWEPLRPELVVEVRYDHVSGNRFRHGTRLERWRPDKAPQQCTFEQLQAPMPPDTLLRIALHDHARPQSSQSASSLSLQKTAATRARRMHAMSAR